MDIIISANNDIKTIIKNIPLNENKKVDSEKFQEMITRISGRKENDEV